MPRQTPLAEAVYQTVTWFSVFGQSATAEELHRYLLGRRATLAEVKAALYSDSRLHHSFGFFHRIGEGGQVIARCRHYYQSGLLWPRVLRYRFVLRATPFLQLAAVGNTLAFGWPEEGSDIDLLIVAERRRLFTTRALLTLYLHLLGVRRHGEHVAKRFCLSFFLADSKQDLSRFALPQGDPYLAFWTASLVPLWAADYSTWQSQQCWLDTTLPNWKSGKKLRVDSRKSISRYILEWSLGGKLGDALESLLRRWQLRRAHAKKQKQYTTETSVVVTPEILKFHENDRRAEYAASWAKLCKIPPTKPPKTVKKSPRKSKKSTRKG
jgi:hypothetical protein